MQAFELLRRLLVEAGAAVDVHVGCDVVTAEQSLGIVEIVDAAIGGLDQNRPYRAIAKDIQRAVVRKTVFENVIFSAISGTRGAKAGTRPFIEFLHAAGFTTPFMFTTSTESRPAYRTANYQFVMIYNNITGVGNIGPVSLVEFNSKRKTTGVTSRSIRKLLSQCAENVPNERGVTKAQKQLGHAPAKTATVTETETVINDAALAEPVDTDKAKGQRFQSFQELAACLL